MADVTPQKMVRTNGPADPIPGAGAGAFEAARERSVDVRAVRVTVAPTTRIEGDPAITVVPPPDAASVLPGDPLPAGDDPIVDGTAVHARLERFGPQRARLSLGDALGVTRAPIVLGELRVDRARGTTVREVVVHGWRIDVEIESERRALLRERARRGAGAQSHGGPLEVHAIIPGRVVAISVKPGDTIDAGGQLLVVEAMKMQNELRAPREGTIERVGVAVGQTIEVGDLLVVIT